jgi:hypothetical protein
MRTRLKITCQRQNTLTYLASLCVTKKTNQLAAILTKTNALAYCVRALKNDYSCKYKDRSKDNLPETNILTYFTSPCVTKKTYQLAAILTQTNALAYCVRALKNDYSCKYEDKPKIICQRKQSNIFWAPRTFPKQNNPECKNPKSRWAAKSRT